VRDRRERLTQEREKEREKERERERRVRDERESDIAFLRFLLCVKFLSCVRDQRERE